MSSPTTQTHHPSEIVEAQRESSSPAFLEDAEAAIVLDDDGIIDYVSAEARRLLDLGTRPLPNRNFFTRIPRNDFGRVARSLHELSASEDGRTTELIQLQTGLGPWQWFKVEIIPRRRYEEKAGVILHLHERGRSHS